MKEEGENCLARSLTIRDFFAGMALAGIVAGNDDFILYETRIRRAAEDAYQCADALLAARQPTKPWVSKESEP